MGEKMRTQTPNSLAILLLLLYFVSSISLEMVFDGSFCFVCLVAFFRSVLLNASFTTDMVCVQIENKIMARRYTVKQRKKNSARPSDSKTLTNITDAHIWTESHTEWEKTSRSSRSTITLTFWLINYAHIQINTVLAMSHTPKQKKRTENS